MLSMLDRITIVRFPLIKQNPFCEVKHHKRDFPFLKYLDEKQLLDFLSIETERSDICEEKYNNRYDS